MEPVTSQLNERLVRVIEYAARAHDEAARDEGNRIRRWDMRTPYIVHPVWCAMTLLQEPNIPEEVRYAGAEALILHDVLEDTTHSLPPDTSDRVRALVQGMTFDDSKQERELVWERGDEIILLKLYDKTSNFLDASWKSHEKMEEYASYLLKFVERVQKAYGDLNIVLMARALAQNPHRFEKKA